MGDLVEQIVDLVARSSVGSVTVRSQGLRITVRKASLPSDQGDGLRAASHPAPDVSGGSGEAATHGAAADTANQADAWVIRAQRVGVFRHADPRVTPGMPVVMGQAVGTIISMNLPSEVRAHRGGIVSGVLIEDGSPVEYDQPLFTIADAGQLPGDRSSAPGWTGGSPSDRHTADVEGP